MFTNSLFDQRKFFVVSFFCLHFYNVSHLSSPFPVVEWEWWPIAHKCSQVFICDHSLIQQQYHNPLQHCLPDCHSLTPLYLKHHWRSGITYWRQFFILNLTQLNPLAMMDIEPWPLLKVFFFFLNVTLNGCSSNGWWNGNSLISTIEMG